MIHRFYSLVSKTVCTRYLCNGLKQHSAALRVFKPFQSYLVHTVPIDQLKPVHHLYTIDHQILLYKLEAYGIRGTALSWFKDYLCNRQQYVAFNSTESTKLMIKCGVPQGSILGPLLFLLYINDIVNSSNLLSFILFADDTNLLYSHNDLKTLIS